MRPKRNSSPLPPKTPLNAKQRLRLRRAVIEGCHDMAEVNIEIEREYHPLEEEVDRLLNEEDN